MTRKCQLCGEPLAANASPTRKFCSSRCRYVSRDIPEARRAQCSKCGKDVWRGPGAAADAIVTCRPCRAESRGGHHSNCKCVRCLALNAERVAEWSARYIAEHGEHPSTAYRRKNGRKDKPRERKPCRQCGELHGLEPNGKTLDTLGLSHARALARYGPPSDSRELIVWVDPNPVPAHVRSTLPPLTRAATRGGVFYCGPCQWCGETFTGWSTHSPVRLCSKQCERAESRLKRGKFQVTPVRRRRLHERDDWTCRICLEPTAREWEAGNPWSPTLDHIEPQAHALIPDHSDANLRTAHAICNALRSDARLSDEQVRREVTRRFANVAA